MPICLIKKIKFFIHRKHAVTWHGDFADWQSAELACGKGYSNEQIIEKVVNATRKVVSGEAAFERDSVTFDKIEYSWPLATAITWAAARAQGCLRVVDFGGALGSSYRQNHAFLQGLSSVQWVVVEQPAFVDIGQKEFTTNELLFDASLDNAIETYKPNLILVPSVLQYLEKPFEWVNKIASSSADIVVFDRTSISLESRTRLTVQHVPPSIYEAQYPCWIFDENKLLELMQKNYTLVEKFSSAFNTSFRIDNKVAACEVGYIFKRKSLK